MGTLSEDCVMILDAMHIKARIQCNKSEVWLEGFCGLWNRSVKTTTMTKQQPKSSCWSAFGKGGKFPVAFFFISISLWCVLLYKCQP